MVEVSGFRFRDGRKNRPYGVGSSSGGGQMRSVALNLPIKIGSTAARGAADANPQIRGNNTKCRTVRVWRPEDQGVVGGARAQGRKYRPVSQRILRQRLPHTMRHSRRGQSPRYETQSYQRCTGPLPALWNRRFQCRTHPRTFHLVC